MLVAAKNFRYAPITKHRYISIRNFVWHVGKKDSGLSFIIPSGTEFDSSVPWWLQWWISPHDPDYILAACVHDYLLEDGYRPAFAAGEWHDAALAARAPRHKTMFMYLGVALWTIWRRM